MLPWKFCQHGIPPLRFTEQRMRGKYARAVLGRDGAKGHVAGLALTERGTWYIFAFVQTP